MKKEIFNINEFEVWVESFKAFIAVRNHVFTSADFWTFLKEWSFKNTSPEFRSFILNYDNNGAEEMIEMLLDFFLLPYDEKSFIYQVCYCVFWSILAMLEHEFTAIDNNKKEQLRLYDIKNKELELELAKCKGNLKTAKDELAKTSAFKKLINDQDRKICALTNKLEKLEKTESDTNKWACKKKSERKQNKA